MIIGDSHTIKMSSTSTPLMVSELTSRIKNQLESSFRTLQVQGEISNLKLHSSGHLYFDLKDKQAKISAVLFKNSRWPHMRLPKEGDSVLVTASLSVYAPQGKYQLIVKNLELAGIGELLAKLEELKQKLREKGYFENKKPLPAFPKKIGVVTSPTGAVIRDIIHVLSRRLKGFNLILNPVRVQGEGAAEEIAKAIAEFNQYEMVDVIIVGRGGGSLEDLWPFNEEIVAKAIFDSQIPIISAVGHETDVTLADLVADKRAPTPSAAAEIVSGETEKFLKELTKIQCLMQKSLLQKFRFYSSQLDAFKRHPLFATPYNLLAMPLQRLDEFKLMLDRVMREKFLQKKMVLVQKAHYMSEYNPLRRLKILQEKVNGYRRHFDDKMQTTLVLTQKHLTQVKENLESLNPKKVLKRGYSILFAQKENSVIVSTHQLAPGDRVRALLSDGERELTVHDEV